MNSNGIHIIPLEEETNYCVYHNNLIEEFQGVPEGARSPGGSSGLKMINSAFTLLFWCTYIKKAL